MDMTCHKDDVTGGRDVFRIRPEDLVILVIHLIEGKNLLLQTAVSRHSRLRDYRFLQHGAQEFPALLLFFFLRLLQI